MYHTEESGLNQTSHRFHTKLIVAKYLVFTYNIDIRSFRNVDKIRKIIKLPQNYVQIRQNTKQTYPVAVKKAKNSCNGFSSKYQEQTSKELKNKTKKILLTKRVSLFSHLGSKVSLS